MSEFIRALLRGVLAVLRVLPLLGWGITWMDRNWPLWKGQLMFLLSYFSGSIGVALYSAALVAAFPRLLPLIQIAMAIGILLLVRVGASAIDAGVRRFMTVSYLGFGVVAIGNLLLSREFQRLPELAQAQGLQQLGLIGITAVLLNGLRRTVGGIQDRGIPPYFSDWGRYRRVIAVALGFGDQGVNVLATSVAKLALVGGHVDWLFIASGGASVAAALFALLGPDPEPSREAPTVEEEGEQEQAAPPVLAAQAASPYKAGTLTFLLLNFVLFFFTLQIGRDFDPARLKDWVGGPETFLLDVIQASQLGEVASGAFMLFAVRVGLVSETPSIEFLLLAAGAVGVLAAVIPWLPLVWIPLAFFAMGFAAFIFDRLSYTVRAELLPTRRLLNFFSLITLLALIGQPTVSILFQIFGTRIVPYVWGFGSFLAISSALSIVALRLPEDRLRAWDDWVREALYAPEQGIITGLRGLSFIVVSALSTLIVGWPITFLGELGVVITYMTWIILKSQVRRFEIWLLRGRRPAQRARRIRNVGEPPTLLEKIFRRRDDRWF